MMFLKAIFVAYLIVLVSWYWSMLAYGGRTKNGEIIEGFIFPSILLMLIPFRTGGYLAKDGFIFRAKWLWSPINLTEHPTVKKLIEAEIKRLEKKEHEDSSSTR